MTEPPSSIACPACGAEVVASYERIDRSAQVDTGRVPAGVRVDLAPGFVNAPVRHSSGMPWYRRSERWPDRRTRVTRLPAVVTCRCGHDVALPSVDVLTKEFATLSREQSGVKLDRLLRLAAGMSEDDPEG